VIGSHFGQDTVSGELVIAGIDQWSLYPAPE